MWNSKIGHTSYVKKLINYFYWIHQELYENEFELSNSKSFSLINEFDTILPPQFNGGSQREGAMRLYNIGSGCGDVK